MVVAVREGRERGREGGREVFIVTGCKLLSGNFISIYISIFLFYIYSFILYLYFYFISIVLFHGIQQQLLHVAIWRAKIG